MNKKILITVIIGTTLLITTAILFFFIGGRVILQYLKVIVVTIIVLAVIAFAVWAIWFFIIKKHKFDATAVNKKKISKAGKLQCPETIRGRTLRLSGDKGHSYYDFGTIQGYLQVQVLTKEKALNKNGEQEVEIIRTPNLMTGEEETKKIPLYKITNEPQDIFIVKPNKGILKMFDEPKVVRVDPRDHDELIGDVTLFGINLVPVSEYYYLNTDYLDAQKIDQTILNEAKRGITFDLMRDWRSTIDVAINLDARHRKEQDQKHLFEVPQLQQMGVQQK